MFTSDLALGAEVDVIKNMKFCFGGELHGDAGRAGEPGLGRAASRVVLVRCSLAHQVQSQILPSQNYRGGLCQRQGGRSVWRSNIPVSYCFSDSVTLLVSMEWLSSDSLKLMSSCFSASKKFRLQQNSSHDPFHMYFSSCINPFGSIRREEKTLRSNSLKLIVFLNKYLITSI